MNIVFSDQPLPTQQVKSIFLAGPSPRSADIEDWRPAALQLLQEMGFDGTVFVPVPSYRFNNQTSLTNPQGWAYEDQISWEVQARQMADVIAFWLPRTLDLSRKDLGMPGFTTNFEMGEDLHSGKLHYGRPSTAAKCVYLDERAQNKGLVVHTELGDLLKACVQSLGAGAFRQGGEAKVPLLIWRSEPFQHWYGNLQAAGNRLDDARVVSAVFAASGPLFAFTLWVKVWVASEQRHKGNEVVVARKDVSSVFAFTRSAQGPVRVALVKEFRSTVNNAGGFVLELPGGSSFNPKEDPCYCASSELHEETGMPRLASERFSRIGQRQLAATFATHRATVFAVELSEQEFEYFEEVARAGEFFGDNPHADNAERTYVQTYSLAELVSADVDYSTLGMVFECAAKLGLMKV